MEERCRMISFYSGSFYFYLRSFPSDPSSVIQHQKHSPTTTANYERGSALRSPGLSQCNNKLFSSSKVWGRMIQSCAPMSVTFYFFSRPIRLRSACCCCLVPCADIRLFRTADRYINEFIIERHRILVKGRIYIFKKMFSFIVV